MIFDGHIELSDLIVVFRLSVLYVKSSYNQNIMTRQSTHELPVYYCEYAVMSQFVNAGTSPLCHMHRLGSVTLALASKRENESPELYLTEKLTHEMRH